MLVMLVNIALGAIALLVCVPILVLSLECALAVLHSVWRSRTGDSHDPPRVAVVIPAHDEALVIEHTLRSITPQLREGDQLIVVADNCTDDTHAIASACGATVYVRDNPSLRGKGYALDHGIQGLVADPPEVVVLVDADCEVAPGAIGRLAAAAAAAQRPVQARYLIEQPPMPEPTDLVSALAVLVKNRVRPSGLAAAGMPCLLTGSGMAFPWSVIVDAPLATGNIVEDMQLGIDLSIKGQAPRYCDDACVTGRLPAERVAATLQRTRWEHGHLSTMLRQAPRLLIAGVRQRRPSLVVMALDVAVPPLSLLTFAYVLALVLCAACMWVDDSYAAHVVTLLASGMIMAVALVGAWAAYGRDSLPLLSLLAAPLYIVRKLPMYVAFTVRPQRAWVRTRRDPTSTGTET